MDEVSNVMVCGGAQVPALEGQGIPDVETHVDIPMDQLPHDSQGRLLRPGVVWYACCHSYLCDAPMCMLRS